VPRMVRLRRVLTGWMLVFGLTAPSAGCLGFLHTIKEPTATACQDLPAPCREHIHVFLIDGLDPCDLANLRGVRDYVNALGFQNTRYGQFYDAEPFGDEIRRIHKDDAAARFVVIGFSLGARRARGMVESLQGDGVHVDLLVYLDGKSLMYVSPDAPGNVDRVLSAVGPGVVWTAPQLPGADNVVLSDVWHFGVPSHPRTLEALARELAMVAGESAGAGAGTAPPLGPSSDLTP
jgi:hypothetical protein